MVQKKKKATGESSRVGIIGLVQETLDTALEPFGIQRGGPEGIIVNFYEARKDRMTPEELASAVQARVQSELERHPKAPLVIYIGQEAKRQEIDIYRGPQYDERRSG
ncbi:hypothetical protein HYS48_00800 [Candidatus Woesearchaeota archaeon]|nr:hypothetical protein [Candidatus Woesearchaeota archaeon]